MGARRKARIFALNAIYLHDICGFPVEESIKIISNHHKLNPSTRHFAKILIEGVKNNRKEIDDAISKTIKHWELKRLSAIDRNIIRLATFELMAMPETPTKVIINEAIEIAKHYSTEDSGKFVNGVLDKIKETYRSKEVKNKWSKT